MASLFGTNKKESKKPARAKAASKRAVAAKSPAAAVPASVLVRPHITEKAAQATAKGVYTFEVAKSATKTQVMEAVQALYKVSPVKVAMVKVPRKRVQLRRKRGYGTKGGLKKAYVYLKDGDRIEFAS